MKKIYIWWEWINTGNFIDIIYPFSWKKIDEVCVAWEEHVEMAIKKAEKWLIKTKKLEPWQRSKILQNIVFDLKTKKEDFAKTLVLENWKTITEARSEMDRCISTYEIAIWETERISWEYNNLAINNMSTHRHAIVKKFPIWIIAWIAPFNFPMNLSAHKIAPAIATWCPIILKPSSKTPLTALMLASIIEKSWWPKAAFSVVVCYRIVWQKLVEDDRINLLSFTWSPNVWWEMKNKAWKKKVVLELGWNAWVIIDKKIDDWDWLINRLSLWAFYQAGQSCISVQKIYVHKSIYEELKEKLITKIKTMKVWDPVDIKSDIWWLIDNKNRIRLWNWINKAIENWATCPIWNKWDWTILYPTLLENVSNSTEISKEEAFWPVAILYKYSDFDKVLKEINKSKYWLQVWIFSKNIDKIWKLFEEAEVWWVIQNDIPSFRSDAMPYWWIKDSWFWREGVKYAMMDMLEEKVLVLNV